MSRKCTVCTHEQLEKIDCSLINDVPFRKISKQYGVSTGALQRHKRDHIAKDLITASHAFEVADPDSIMAEVEQIKGFTNKLLKACDRYLTDPDDSSRYDIGPRADDIDVIYLEEDEKGKRIRLKERLSALLERLEGKGYLLTGTRYKIADPRELILKAVGEAKGLLELLAKVTGELREAQLNVQINQLGVVFLPEKKTPEQWMKEHGKGNPKSMEPPTKAEDGS